MGWKDKADDELKKPRKGGSWKLKEAENEIRVLPTNLKKKDKEPAVYYVHMIHTGVGPEKRVVTCGKKADGTGHCWLCDKQIPKDAESESKSKRKRAELMTSKEVFSLQIAYMDGKKLRGPELFSMNMGGKKSLAYKLLKTLANPRYDCENLKKGRNIIIEREGTGMATVYSSPVIAEDKTEVPEKVVKLMKTFEEIIPMYDEDRQKTAYFGKNDSDNGSDSASDSDAKKKSSSDSDSDSDSDDKKKGSDSDSEATSDSSSKSGSDSDEKKDSSDADSDDKKESDSGSDSGSDSASGSASTSDSDADEKPKRGTRKKPGPKKGAKKTAKNKKKK